MAKVTYGTPLRDMNSQAVTLPLTFSGEGVSDILDLSAYDFDLDKLTGSDIAIEPYLYKKSALTYDLVLVPALYTRGVVKITPPTVIDVVKNAIISLGETLTAGNPQVSGDFKEKFIAYAAIPPQVVNRKIPNALEAGQAYDIDIDFNIETTGLGAHDIVIAGVDPGQPILYFAPTPAPDVSPATRATAYNDDTVPAKYFRLKFSPAQTVRGDLNVFLREKSVFASDGSQDGFHLAPDADQMTFTEAELLQHPYFKIWAIAGERVPNISNASITVTGGPPGVTVTQRISATGNERLLQMEGRAVEVGSGTMVITAVTDRGTTTLSLPWSVVPSGALDVFFVEGGAGGAAGQVPTIPTTAKQRLTVDTPYSLNIQVSQAPLTAGKVEGLQRGLYYSLDKTNGILSVHGTPKELITLETWTVSAENANGKATNQTILYEVVPKAPAFGTLPQTAVDLYVDYDFDFKVPLLNRPTSASVTSDLIAARYELVEENEREYLRIYGKVPTAAVLSEITGTFALAIANAAGSATLSLTWNVKPGPPPLMGQVSYFSNYRSLQAHFTRIPGAWGYQIKISGGEWLSLLLLPTSTPQTFIGISPQVNLPVANYGVQARISEPWVGEPSNVETIAIQNFLRIGVVNEYNSPYGLALDGEFLITFVTFSLNTRPDQGTAENTIYRYNKRTLTYDSKITGVKVPTWLGAGPILWHIALFAKDGKIYIAFGRQGGSGNQQIDIYEYAASDLTTTTRTWTVSPEYRLQTVFVDDTFIYLQVDETNTKLIRVKLSDGTVTRQADFQSNALPIAFLSGEQGVRVGTYKAVANGPDLVGVFVAVFDTSQYESRSDRFGENLEKEYPLTQYSGIFTQCYDPETGTIYGVDGPSINQNRGRSFIYLIEDREIEPFEMKTVTVVSGASTAAFTWLRNRWANGYEYRKGTSGAWTTIAANAFQLTVPNLDVGMATYQFRAYYDRTGTYKIYTKPRTVTFYIGTFPTLVFNEVLQTSTTTYRISWGAVTNATAYEYRTRRQGQNWSAWTETTDGARQFTLTAAVEYDGQTFYYEARVKQPAVGNATSGSLVSNAKPTLGAYAWPIVVTQSHGTVDIRIPIYGGATTVTLETWNASTSSWHTINQYPRQNIEQSVSWSWDSMEQKFRIRGSATQSQSVTVLLRIKLTNAQGTTTYTAVSGQAPYTLRVGGN